MVAPILPLVVDGVVLRRRGRRILGPVSLTIEAGGITVLMGPNGSGKTSLLRAMHGLERLNDGAVRWQAPLDETRARQAFVFQAPIVLRRSVLDNIAYPLVLDGVRRVVARARAAAHAADVGIAGLLDRPAQVLSGGEKQKLALARALMRKPEVLFLDEPCANLDPRATRDIEAILRRAAEAGTKIVMSTHDAGQARRLAAEILFLHEGRVIEAAPADAFFANPQTPEARAHVNGDLLP
ncbi:ATP-binding cassette domain-containing protein [Albidovulum sediminicola]|uniref:ATP-binding cassette domain-containing protein n=1 Tax=Albidovulum sediminicola TaxID=2984331 RepID=A0ABT2Z058_9RHOB|nr:ATP-binding cassette domain-containing protein [Defluviimonas sp. WL0075]MCV2864534.1 ATP-binding cassette domain-containing protein [Defluviimonas sp. WL0075]